MPNLRAGGNARRPSVGPGTGGLGDVRCRAGCTVTFCIFSCMGPRVTSNWPAAPSLVSAPAAGLHVLRSSAPGHPVNEGRQHALGTCAPRSSPAPDAVQGRQRSVATGASRLPLSPQPPAPNSQAAAHTGALEAGNEGLHEHEQQRPPGGQAHPGSHSADRAGQTPLGSLGGRSSRALAAGLTHARAAPPPGTRGPSWAAGRGVHVGHVRAELMPTQASKSKLAPPGTHPAHQARAMPAPSRDCAERAAALVHPARRAGAAGTDCKAPCPPDAPLHLLPRPQPPRPSNHSSDFLPRDDPSALAP